MAIETRCIIKCDICGASTNAVIRYRPTPETSEGFIELNILRLCPIGPVEIQYSNDWSIHGRNGEIRCDKCRLPSHGPYR